MSTAVFIDTNVLLYAYDRADPTKNARAREWVARLWHDRHGRTSMQVLSEYYVNLTRKFRVPAEAAWDDAASFFAWRPQPIDESLLRRAREVSRRYQISWWDSLIVAAAQLQDCLVLLTEDLQDGMVFGTLAVRSPFSAVLEEAPAAYEVARAAPLHRRSRIDEISGRLCLEEVHLAVEDGAPGELARLRGTRSGCGEGGERRGGDDQTAVRRDLDEVLAGIGVRTRETGGEAVVDRLSGVGLQQPRAEHGARWDRVEGFQAAGGDGERSDARQANQRERSATQWRRQRDDGVGEQV